MAASISTAATASALLLGLLGGIFWAHREAPAAPGDRAEESPASLVLSYELEDGYRAQHHVWFVDTLGRRFSFSRSCDDALAIAEGARSVTPKEVAALVGLSQSVGPALPRKDVEHIEALVAASRAAPDRRNTSPNRCTDAATIRIRAYWQEGSGSSFVTLWESYCDKMMRQNTSPAAQELVSWVRDQAGVWEDHGQMPAMPQSMFTRSAMEVRELARSDQARTTACYDTAVRTNPKLSGRVVMNWTVDAHGAAQNIKVGSDSSRSMKASPVPDCLQAVIATWRFRKTCPNSNDGYSWDFPPR